MKMHLDFFSLRPAVTNLTNTISRFCKCCSIILPVISSSYTATFGSPCNRESIVLWNIPGAEDTPNGNLIYCNKFLCALIVVRGLAAGRYFLKSV